MEPTARALPDPAGYGPSFTSPSSGSPSPSGAGDGPGRGAAPRFGAPGRAAEIATDLLPRRPRRACGGFLGTPKTAYVPRALLLRTSLQCPRRRPGVRAARGCLRRCLREVVTLQPCVGQSPVCVLVAPVPAALISFWHPIPKQAPVFNSELPGEIRQQLCFCPGVSLECGVMMNSQK